MQKCESGLVVIFRQISICIKEQSAFGFVFPLGLAQKQIEVR